MSLVGPRPLVRRDIELMREVLDSATFDEWYQAYTDCTPGLVSQFSNESRQYIPQTADYLQKRAKTDIEYHEIASKEVDTQIMRDSVKVGIQYARNLLPAAPVTTFEQ